VKQSVSGEERGLLRVRGVTGCHLVLVSEQASGCLMTYLRHYNTHRPHRTPGQRAPDGHEYTPDHQGRCDVTACSGIDQRISAGRMTEPSFFGTHTCSRDTGSVGYLGKIQGGEPVPPIDR
jgi:hypothetical protein